MLVVLIISITRKYSYPTNFASGNEKKENVFSLFENTFVKYCHLLADHGQHQVSVTTPA